MPTDRTSTIAFLDALSRQSGDWLHTIEDAAVVAFPGEFVRTPLGVAVRGGGTTLVLRVLGLLAISDAGTWLRATIDSDGRKVKGLSEATIGPILGRDGKPLATDAQDEARHDPRIPEIQPEAARVQVDVAERVGQQVAVAVLEDLDRAEVGAARDGQFAGRQEPDVGGVSHRGRPRRSAR